MNLKEKIDNLPPPVREWGVFAAWLGGLLLAGILLWGTTSQARSRALVRQVNRSLARQESPLRLGEPLGNWGRPGSASFFGSWFTLAGEEAARSEDPGGAKWAVVFPIMSGGQSAAVLGLVDGDGAVGRIVPLSANARDRLASVPAGTVRLYLGRIEESFRMIRGAR